VKLHPLCTALACALLLSACGGGSDSTTGTTTPSTGTQQYPGGFWEGTSGTGTAQRSVFGYIDPGLSGTGGDFMFARAYNSSNGFDAFYGALTVTGQSLVGSGVRYYSGQDGKFAANLALRGTVTPNAQGQASHIAGNYSDPVGTAASTGAIVPLVLDYSSANQYPAKLASLVGTYRSVGAFGAIWRLDIDAQGALIGTNGGCTMTGAASVRSATSAAFNISMTLNGSTVACPNSGTTQTGVAALQYDSSGNRSGIRVLTRNASGTESVVVMSGTIDPGSIPSPSATQQNAQGSWIGTVGSGSAAQAIAASVMPDGSYFFYRRVGGGYDALYGTLAVAIGGSAVSSVDGFYFANQAGSYTGGVALTGDVKTSTSFTGQYFDPTAENALANFSLTPDANYPYTTGLAATLANLSGTYRSTAAAFGGDAITLTVDGSLGTITGSTSSGCAITGTIGRYGTDATRNAFAVEQLAFSGASCALSGTPVQSGIANAQFNAGASATGLRILAAGTSASSTRATTVFLGTRTN